VTATDIADVLSAAAERAEVLDAGHLDVRFADESPGHSAWELLAATVSADLYNSSSYVEFRRPSLAVGITGQTGYLTRDGDQFSVRR
jgi:hypothetical protein